MLTRWYGPIAAMMTDNIQEEQVDEDGLYPQTLPETQGIGCCSSDNSPEFFLKYPAELSPQKTAH